MQISDKKGMPPGTLTYVGKLKPVKTEISLHCYDDTSINTTAFTDLSTLQSLLAQSDKRLWIDIVGLQDIDTIASICQHLDVHPLVVEDLFNTHQRTKVEFFDDYLFFVVKSITQTPANDSISFRQISAIVTEHCIITVCERTCPAFNSLYERLNAEHSRLRSRGVDYMGYAVLDSLVDDYMVFLDSKGGLIEGFENTIIDSKQELSLKKIYAVRRMLIKLRKAVQPLRDVAGALLKSESTVIIKSSTQVYLHDLLDHCVNLLENVDGYREMTSSILEMYLSSLNNRMNETMKVLTIFASIFIPLTFIAGLYGMNFSNMPELKWHYGYFFSLGIMALVAGTMLIIFKIKKWF